MAADRLAGAGMRISHCAGRCSPRAPLGFLASCSRVGAVILLATLLISPASRALLGTPIAAAVLVFIGCVSLLWTRLRSGKEQSALIGRFTDIFQALSLTVVFPAAFFAADLFELVRQVAS